MPRERERGPTPRGRNAILTNDPILRALFVEMHQRRLLAAPTAKAIGISTVAFSRWKKGLHTPDIDLVQAFANVLDYDLILKKRKPA